MRKLSPDPKAAERQPPGTKECGKCKKVLARTSEFFDRDKEKPDGFKGWCKQCRQDRRDLVKVKDAVALVQTLDAGVLANLSQAKPGGSITPHQLEFYQCLTTLFGGVQGAAMQWMATFIASNPGSQTRERLLGHYSKLMAACSADQKVSPPAELMSDEELNATIARDEERMRRNEEQMRKGSIEGKVSP